MPKLPSIPENAPFSAAQRLWLNGFLAGLFSEAKAESASGQETEKVARPLHILFGSQTGTAEALARRVATEAANQGFLPRVMEANAGVKVEWSPDKCVLVITSTYGDGDMPDNAQGFWDWLATDAAKPLAQVEYAVLALGDSQYEHFCAAGKRIDARFEELGARRIYPRTDCDVDYAAAAKSWTQGALSALEGARSPNASPSESHAPQPITEPHEAIQKADGFSRQNPFPAELLANRRLTAEGSAKEVRHFEISLAGSGLEYEVGDALGVQPSNCSALVEDLLQAMRWDGEEAVPSPRGEVSLRKALTEHYDITKPSPDLLAQVSQRNPELRALMDSTNKEELKVWLRGREVIDLVTSVASFRLAAPELVALLKPLSPRLYSISSSPKAHTGQVHLTVSIVRHGSHGRDRKGVCSTFLADRAANRTPVPVFVQKSHGFRLPASGDTPIIMVGPGTGVAPFRAFLHERQTVGAKGRNWLFFGEQHSATDFYYQDELDAMLKSKCLTKLTTAFSRDQVEKLYVQHRMETEAAELWAWLQDGAHFYVCGDASRMARDVDAALHLVVEKAGGKTREQAVEFVGQMKTEKRYQRDVY